MIKSIRLLNWRSHRDTLLEFHAGTNLLVGIMGAGKSSVMEGISFALFGTFPAIERKKVKLENVIRQNEPEAKVVLGFEWEGAEYRIERTIARTKKGTDTSAEIFKAGTLSEHGQSAVNTYVSGLLGIDYDLFTRAIYSEQNNMDYFLNLGPGRRKEEMDALLGLDRFESARANAVSVINRIRAKRLIIEEQHSPARLADAEAKEKKLSGEAETLAESLRKAAVSCEARGKEAARAASGFETARKSRDEHERLMREDARLSATLESLKKELAGKRADAAALAALTSKQDAAAKERAVVAASLKAQDARLSALSKESGSLEAGIRAAAEAAKSLDLAKVELSAALGGLDLQSLAVRQKEAEQAAIGAESERKSLQRETADLAESMSRLRPGLSECPMCAAKLTEGGMAHVRAEKERLAAEKKARMKELDARIVALKAESDALLVRFRKASLLGEKRTMLEKEAAGSGALKAKKDGVESMLAAAAAERRALSERSDALTTEVERLRSQIAEQKGLAARQAEAESAAKGLADVKSSLARLKFEEAGFEASRKAAEDSGIEAERAKSAKAALEVQARMAGEMLGLVREELSVMRKAAQEARGLQGLEEELSIFKNALVETQASLRLSLADAINAAMNEIWPVFYPYRNYRALRLGVSDKDYVFEVDEGEGQWAGLETVASGGERACAALTLRVALAMVLTPKLGWLILDEPTHNLDTGAIELLSSALEFKVPEVVKQTFVITHDEVFMGSDFASSYRLSRDKAANGDTRAEAL
jgi:DNA repair protein SbcC/Rad50